jgi:hypothetical protein
VAAVALAAVLVLTTRGRSAAGPPPGRISLDTSLRAPTPQAQPGVGVEVGTAGVDSDSAPGALAGTVDSSSRRDSTLTPNLRQTLNIVVPPGVKRPLRLQKGDSLQLTAVLREGQRAQSNRDAAAIAWSITSGSGFAIRGNGWLHVIADSGRATITARLGALKSDRLSVEIARPRAVVGKGGQDSAVAPPVLLTDEQAHRLVDRVTDAVRGQRVDPLSQLFAAGQGGPSAGRLLETIGKERELKVEFETRTFTNDPEHPTLRAGWKLSWKRGGLGGKIKGERDNKTADLVVRFEREGTGWRVQSLQLEREFKP